MLCKNTFIKFILIPALVLVLSFNYSYSRSKKHKKVKRAKRTTQVKQVLTFDADSLLNSLNHNKIVNDSLIGDAGEDIEELVKLNGENIDVYTAEDMWNQYLDRGEVSDYTDNGIDKLKFLDNIANWLGTRYRFGGTTRQGIDCSAFMRELYKDALNIELPRTANEQYSYGKTIQEDNLQFGDLVFFKTQRYAPITHVGVYLGDDKFAHASSRGGVMISDLSSPYYTKTFRGGRRLTNKEIVKLEINNELSTFSDVEEDKGTK